MWTRSLFLLATMLLLRDAAAAEPGVQCRQTAEAIEITSGGRTVLHYHTAVALPPAGIDPVYRRSGFIHPVCTPSGRIVTADFPVDHAHQHGIFSAWVNTTFEGRKVDFWNQKGRTGTVEHVDVVNVRSSSNSAGFIVQQMHSDLTAPGGPKPVLQETWELECREADGAFIFDLSRTQTCIADSPLTINEYHYGGMAFRGCDQWYSEDKERPVDFTFDTDAGVGRIAGNHTRPRWVVAQGTVDGQMCGIAVMGHPSNFRHPEPVRLHPTKPYFAFSPCVLGEFQLEPGVAHESRYRYVVFDGAADAERLEQEWQEFAAVSPSGEPHPVPDGR